MPVCNVEKPKNRLLTALPTEDYQRLLPHLEHVTLSCEQVLYRPGDVISDVYFPCRSLVSITHLTATDSPTCLVGQEGMVGISVILGDAQARQHMVVQTAGEAIRLPSDVLQLEFNRGGRLQTLLLRYVQAVLLQISQLAACNRRHVVQKQLACQLLLIQDTLERDEFSLSPELLVKLLGTRHATISTESCALEQAGMIDTRRDASELGEVNRIKILDRQRLEAYACECYERVRAEFEGVRATFGTI